MGVAVVGEVDVHGGGEDCVGLLDEGVAVVVADLAEVAVPDAPAGVFGPGAAELVGAVAGEDAGVVVVSGEFLGFGGAEDDEVGLVGAGGGAHDSGCSLGCSSVAVWRVVRPASMSSRESCWVSSAVTAAWARVRMRGWPWGSVQRAAVVSACWSSRPVVTVAWWWAPWGQGVWAVKARVPGVWVMWAPDGKRMVWVPSGRGSRRLCGGWGGRRGGLRSGRVSGLR